MTNESNQDCYKGDAINRDAINRVSTVASIPGSIILLGEHAVLKGYPAVACAVNQYMHVELIPRSDRCVNIYSDRLGELKTTLDDIKIQKPFQFVLTAVLQYQNELMQGFDLHIRSEFSDKVGLSSSAAVTVGTVSVLRKYLKKDDDKIICRESEPSLNPQSSILNPKMSLFHDALKVIHAVQGKGSGYDVAVAVFGGTIRYQLNPIKIEVLNDVPNLGLIYCGYKTPTPEVIAHVEKLEKERPEFYQNLYREIGECVERGVIAIQKKDWSALGNVFNEHQSLMKAMGVSDETLDHIIDELLKQPKILGAKISGSGLGDCVVFLG